MYTVVINAFSRESNAQAHNKAVGRILKIMISIESAIHADPVTHDNFMLNIPNPNFSTIILLIFIILF